MAAAEEQGQQLQLHQHLDSAEAEVQAEASSGPVAALARTQKKMVLFYDLLH
jgi:hypothetical protein